MIGSAIFAIGGSVKLKTLSGIEGASGRLGLHPLEQQAP
jgi:hypothetical protein